MISDRDRPLRVLFLIREIEIGGGQVAVLSLSKGLKGLGCQPIVLPWRRRGALESRFVDADIPLLNFGPVIGLRGLTRVPRRVHEIAAANDVDLIHAHMSDSTFWAARAHRMGGPPMVASHHSTNLMEAAGEGRPIYGWIRRQMLRHGIKIAAKNIAVSESVRDSLYHKFGIDKADVRVIPNGVDVPSAEELEESRSARLARAQNNYPDGPSLVFVGRLDLRKGVETLINAMKAIHESHPRATLDILGDGVDRARFEAQARSLGLTDVVRFAGAVTNVGERLSKADVMISASREEGLPFALLEGMAWALPIVATDIPGHNDIVDDSKTGRLFPLDDAAAAAVTCTEMLANPGLAEACGARAFDLVDAQYSLTAMARAHLKLYHSVLAGNPLPSMASRYRESTNSL